MAKKKEEVTTKMSKEHRTEILDALDYYLTKYPDADFYLSEEQVNITEVRTVLDKPLFRSKPSFETGYFAFIDLKPGANWAHDCIYLFMQVVSTGYHREGKMEQANNEMPPQDKWFNLLSDFKISPETVERRKVERR